VSSTSSRRSSSTGSAAGARPIPIPDQEYVVRRCLKAVLREEVEHHRYAIRDLAVLEVDD
jgi:hypothetical protein